MTEDAGDTRRDDVVSPAVDRAVVTDEGAPMCPAPRVLCGSSCVDVRSDGQNCGGCGLRCEGGAACSGAQCVTGPSCQDPLRMCGSACVDVQSSTAHCGACNRACASGQRCTSGQCVTPPSCNAPLVLCDTACVNPNTDARNCGVCGFLCGGGERCSNGVCTSGPVDAGTQPVDAGGTPGAVGSACSSDAQCAPLACLTSLTAGGVCGAVCNPGTASSEAAQCGSNGTCVRGVPLVGPDMQPVPGFCLRGCNVSAPAGTSQACRAGFVCTGFWFNQSASNVEATGCYPFCSSDNHCVGTSAGGVPTPRCNLRTGSCLPTPPPTGLLADGQPCDPQRIQQTGQPQCRGLCFRLSTTNMTQGICGSYLNLATTTRCPDVPDMQPLSPQSGDNFAVCIFQPCSTSAQCSSPFICRYPESQGQPVTQAPRQCDYPTTAQPR